jgi:hypothetical protein
LAVRNFPATVAELRKRFKWGEGGDLYLFACTLSDGKKAILVAEKIKKVRLQFADIQRRNNFVEKKMK